MKKVVILMLISFGLTACCCRHYHCNHGHCKTVVQQPVKVIDRMHSENHAK